MDKTFRETAFHDRSSVYQLVADDLRGREADAHDHGEYFRQPEALIDSYCQALNLVVGIRQQIEHSLKLTEKKGSSLPTEDSLRLVVEEICTHLENEGRAEAHMLATHLRAAHAANSQGLRELEAEHRVAIEALTKERDAANDQCNGAWISLHVTRKLAEGKRKRIEQLERECERLRGRLHVLLTARERTERRARRAGPRVWATRRERPVIQDRKPDEAEASSCEPGDALNGDVTPTSAVLASSPPPPPPDLCAICGVRNRSGTHVVCDECGLSLFPAEKGGAS